MLFIYFNLAIVSEKGFYKNIYLPIDWMVGTFFRQKECQKFLQHTMEKRVGLSIVVTYNCGRQVFCVPWSGQDIKYHSKEVHGPNAACLPACFILKILFTCQCTYLPAYRLWQPTKCIRFHVNAAKGAVP